MSNMENYISISVIFISGRGQNKVEPSRMKGHLAYHQVLLSLAPKFIFNVFISLASAVTTLVHVTSALPSVLLQQAVIYLPLHLAHSNPFFMQPSDQVTSFSNMLMWLFILFRVKPSIPTLTLKALYDPVPSYFSNPISQNSPLLIMLCVPWLEIVLPNSIRCFLGGE